MNTEYLFPMLLARDKGGGGGGGTVTEIATGAGLTTDDGQAITSSGTIKANLADDTALSGANLYNIGVDSTGYLAVVVPWTDTTYTFDGTYDASTNPAATVSTVTNAINALDVAGASSIPASKTISAWSETDGKVSVSTQDIAIAGSQAVLTGYTKASTATAIVPTDTINQAVGKLEKGLDGKQATIDSSHKLSADLVDDTSATHKFATAAQLSQIQTNENNISSLQGKTTGMSEGGSDYITVGGIRVYVSSTAPTGARTGDLWIGG